MLFIILLHSMGGCLAIVSGIHLSHVSCHGAATIVIINIVGPSTLCKCVLILTIPETEIAIRAKEMEESSDW